MSPACNYRAYSNWSLATYPFFSSSKALGNHESPLFTPIVSFPPTLCHEDVLILVRIIKIKVKIEHMSGRLLGFSCIISSVKLFNVCL